MSDIKTYDQEGYDDYLNKETSLLNLRIEANPTAKAIQGDVNTQPVTVDQIPERSIPASKMEWNLRGWTHTMVFSASDQDTVAWALGTLTLNDGVTAFAIGAGNTGNMSALTYIYFDVNKSKVALQVTTTATTAVGVGKIIIAVAQNNAATGKDATYQVFGGAGGVGTYISGADMIAANIITANEMNVNSLSAITTTTGTLIVDSAGYLRGGQTAYNQGLGFYLGYDVNKYKFSIGDPSGDWLTWDGADLESNKFSHLSQATFGGDGTDGALAITTGTTTLDVGAAQIYTKNYTSISITGDGKLAFSNPHANGTLIVLKSQGNVLLTSTTVPCIDASGLGAAVSTNGTYILDDSNHYGVAGSGQASNGTGGIILATKNFYTKSAYNLFTKAIFLACGSGGGAGGAGSGGTVGAGGKGGGGLLIECAGDLNFTGTISVAGLVGESGTGGTNGAGGGGGGGAGGMVVILYKTATATSGTLNTISGNGGSGGTPIGFTAGGNGGKGGGGGGAYGGAGGNGGNGSLSNSGATVGSNGAGTSAGGGGGGGGGCSAVSCVAGAAGGSGGASDNVLVTTNVAFG